MKITIGKNGKNGLNEAAKEKKISSDAPVEPKEELIKARRLRRRVYSAGYKKTVAEFYDKPVFYRTEDDKYCEIDNSIAESNDYFEIPGNSFRTRFYRSAVGGKLFDVDREGHCVELVSLDAASRGCVAENKSIRARSRAESCVLFKGIDGNSDLEYIIDSDRVKENIIVNEKSEKYEYSFALNMRNLYMAVDEDGKRLELFRKESETRDFYIPSPVMYDAAGEQSDSVYFEVSEETNDRLILKVVADADWINSEERVLPVVIDPQIVVEDYHGGNAYNNPNLYTGERSVFRYETYADNVKTSDNGMWICHDASKADSKVINSKIIIDKSRIPSRLLDNLLSATLTLQVEKNSYGNNFSVGNDLFIMSSYGDDGITVDVTDFLKSGGSTAVVELKNRTQTGITTKNNMKFNSPVLQLTSSVDYYGGEENILPAIKTIDGAGGTTNVIYLKDGKVKPCFASLNADNFVLPLRMFHFFTNLNDNSPYGNGWHFGFDKKLTKAAEDDLTNTKYVYTDELGDEYLFVEKYYYTQNDSKVFVDKDDISVDMSGELSYNGHKINTCQFCNGYILAAQMDDFKGAEYLEQRIDEQIQLESYVNQSAISLKSYVIASKTTGQILYELSALTETGFNELLTHKTSSNILVSKSEALQIKSLYSTKTQADATDDAVEQFDMTIAQAQDNFENVKGVFKDYFNKEAQLELLYRQNPVNYIMDEDGLISGFNKFGEFVMEADAYGNYVTINRNKDGLITEIYDSKSAILAFEYSDDRLVSISDSFGRKVRFEYSSGNLSEAVLADGRSIVFGYSYGRLSIVYVKEYSETNYKYDNIRITGLTTSRKDSSGVFGEVTDFDFSYGSNYTKISDAEGNSEKYTFLDSDEVSECEQRDNEGNVVTTEYTYSVDGDNIKTITEITQKNAEPAVTVTRKYDDIRHITEEVTDWQNVSSAVRVKTEVKYSYGLNNKLTEKLTCKYIETNGVCADPIKAYEKYGYTAQGDLVLVESYVEGEEKTSGITYQQKVYDDNGNVIKTISWNSLDSSSKFYSESEVSENGQVIADKDETGATSAEYEYIAGSNVVNAVKYPNGGKLAYGRNPYNFNVTSVTQSTDEGEANTNDLIYENDFLTQVKCGNTAINFTYDSKGRKTSYSINGVSQATYTYTEYSKNGSAVNYGSKTQTLNDGTVLVKNKTGVIDTDGGISVTETLKADNTTLLSIEYNKKGLVESVVDYRTGGTTFTYDDYDNLKTVRTINGVLIHGEDYTYNANAELTQKVYTGTVSQTYTYAYKNNAARDLDYIGFDTYKFYPLTDVNGRNTGREILSGENKLAAEYITYRKVGDHATNMPASVWFASGNSVDENIKYRYDSCGNICEITENGHLVARYKYDSLNRLIREDNKALDKTSIYTYDTNGNIADRCEYAYTSKDGDELSELECTHYSYDYDGDKLVSYNGASIEYNTLGNPTTYRGNAITWQYGNRLTRYGSTTFTYDGQGRRATKGNISFTYDSDGRLIKQSNGLEFIYDNSGVIGLKYNNAQYFYRRDCQGNIIALIDTSGVVVVKYKYDAWGNHEAEVAAEGYVALAEINPFRYRGYYYDTETGLYYLNTRYYDPEVGRFISRDSIDYATPETINGLNLYAYCGNNPVMCVDPTGTLAWWQNLLIALAGIVIIAGLAVATVVTGGAAAGLAGAIAAGALKGAFIGGVIGIGVGAGIGYAVGGVDGMLTGMAIGFTAGVIIGAVIGGISGGVTYSPLKAASNAAFKAKPAKGFNINKHLNSAGGRHSKFISDSVDDIVSMAQKGLKSQNILIKTNKAAKSWQIIVDVGQVVGTKGQTAIRVIVGYGGKIWTMFPVFL